LTALHAGNLESLASVQDHPRFGFVRGDIGDRGLFGLPVSITNCSNNDGGWYLENEAWVRHIASGSYCRERIGLAGPNHD
jgi:hypothetical protein